MYYVLKFGGSSVSDSKSIKQLVQIVQEKKGKHNYYIVISAIKGITDKLVDCGNLAKLKNNKYLKYIYDVENIHISIIKELFHLKKQSHLISYVKNHINEIENICDSIFQLEELSKRSLDKLMSFGEILSSYLIFKKFEEEGLDSSWKDSRDLIFTDKQFGSAKVDFIKSNQKIIEYCYKTKYKYILLPGFIAYTYNKITTTLGRGSSDYTASILASAIKAEALEIWINVSGMMTADPKIVTQAFPIKNISYEEANELSHFGAKVIHPLTIHKVMENDIPIYIKNIIIPNDSGSCIHKKQKLNINEPVTGISGIKNISLLTLEGREMINTPVYSKRLFETLFNEKINVIFITKSSSEHSITVGIHEENIIKAELAINDEFLQEITQNKINTLSIDNNLCIIAIVGDNMKNLHGTSAKMFYALGKNSINIRAIAQGSTEKNISVVIKKQDFIKSLNILHESFFETPTKQINLFIIGVGKVGSKLIEQIDKQYDYLQKTLKLQFKVIGIANSKKMFLNNQYGIDLKKWNEILQNGQKFDVTIFTKKIIELNLRNSLFIDNTDNKEISMIYHNFLQKGIGVITCNKIACSSNYNYYKKLKTISSNFNAPFLFETNVGAGLPIISTLNDLINSGDKIIKIEAVLSGSLNFIFNNFNKTTSFIEVVKKAYKEGYTEPDPRIDLSGVDVMRKIIILARECGNIIEMNDVKQNIFLPKTCLQTNSIEKFYKELENNSEHFNKIRDNAEKSGKRLRFIAKYEDGNTSVALEYIDNNHPFYNLEGKDNMVSYLTNRYTEPLIIKGAGAGAEVTASGIFSDIIKASR